MGMVVNYITNNNKSNMVATVKINSKQRQRQLLEKVREYCSLSNTDLAMMADCSPTLVSYVWAGVNSNKRVLHLIMENLKPGWKDNLSDQEVDDVMNLCFG